MSKIKRLALETVIYGASNIFVRLLNWLLMPFYIRTMEISDYGQVTYLYSFISILLVILTYGMETSFFRFIKKDHYNNVLFTTLSCLATTSLLFLIVVFSFNISIYEIIEFEGNSDIILIVALILALDAYCSILFAKLRYDGRSIKYSLLKLLNVVVIIGCNVFLLVFCKSIISTEYAYLISWFYNANDAVLYVFVSNLLASFLVFIFLLPEQLSIKGRMDLSLLVKMLKYTWPILIVGITGMININIDKILLPFFSGSNGFEDLAIYGANFKIGVLMAMFAQSFRMAFEPFFFKYADTENIKNTYAQILKYFTLFGLFIFLTVSLFLDIINDVLTSDYNEGTVIVPIVLIAQLFYGIYYTLSLWYKLTDKTIYASIIGIIGVIVTLLINILFVPKYGYIASAWAGLACFFIMTVISIVLGQRFYPVPYDFKKLILYFIFAVAIYFIANQIEVVNVSLKYFINILLLLFFLIIVSLDNGWQKIILDRWKN